MLSAKLSILKFLRVTCILKFVYLYSAKGDSQRLNLNPHLNTFEKCNVLILLNHVEQPYQTNSSGHWQGSYELDKVDIPMTLIKEVYEYLEVENNSTLIQHICNGIPYKITLQPRLRFQHVKLNYFAVVYIDPFPCHNWWYSTARIRDYYLEPPTNTVSDAIYQYKGHSEVQRSPEAYVNQLKSFMFFLAVRRPEWQKLGFPNNFYFDILNSANLMFRPTNGRLLMLDIVNTPAKLIMELKYDLKNEQNVVGKKMMLTCTDHRALLQQVRSSCRPSNVLRYANCQYKALKSYLRYPSIHSLPINEIKDIPYLESLWDHCPIQVWAGEGSHQVPEYPISRSSQSRANMTVDKATIYVNYIFPNSTKTEANKEIAFQYILPHFFIRTGPDPKSDLVYNDELDAIHFLTCVPFGELEGLSVSGYVSAFDKNIWGVLFAITFSSGGIMYSLEILTTRINSHSRPSRRSGFKGMLMKSPMSYYSIFVFQGTNDKFIRVSRWMSSAWFLVCIVLSNAYLGSNINKLTAAIPPKKFETFEEIFDQKLEIDYPIPEAKEVMQMLDGMSQTMLESIKIHIDQMLSSGVHLDRIPFYTFFRRKKSHYPLTKGIQIENLIKSHLSFDQFLQHAREGDEFYVDKISHCRNESFVSNLHDIERISLQLKMKLVQHGN